MKKIIILVAAFLIGSPVLFAQLKADKKETKHQTVYYTCPMHSDVTSKKSGKCPKCGMYLVLSKKEQMKTDLTKTYTCPAHADLVMHNPGMCPKCGKKLDLSPKEQMKTEIAKVYTCPMHPDVALDKNGICPKCGKDLVEKKQQ